MVKLPLKKQIYLETTKEFMEHIGATVVPSSIYIPWRAGHQRLWVKQV